MADERTWLLLSYNVPRKPSAARVYVWRKLKKLGAVALQDAVWVLPNTSQTLEHFRWLAAEIAEMNGESSLWESRSLLEGQSEKLVKQFAAQVDEAYRRILVALGQRKPNLVALARQYQQALARDYVCSELGKRAREALRVARDGTDIERAQSPE